MIKILSVGFFLIMALSATASGAFTIEISEKKVKVIHPQTMGPLPHLVIKNKTLMKIIGKVEGLERPFLLTVPKGEHRSFQFSFPRKKDVSFTSLVPPLQKIPLKSK